jgi:hypothetical protein
MGIGILVCGGVAAGFSVRDSWLDLVKGELLLHP